MAVKAEFVWHKLEHLQEKCGAVFRTDMRKNKNALAALFADRQGATAVEYGLIVAIISGALILGLQSIGTNIEAIFQLISDTLTSVTA